MKERDPNTNPQVDPEALQGGRVWQDDQTEDDFYKPYPPGVEPTHWEQTNE